MLLQNKFILNLIYSKNFLTCMINIQKQINQSIITSVMFYEMLKIYLKQKQ